MKKNKLIIIGVVVVVLLAGIAYFVTIPKDSVKKEEIQAIDQATKNDTTESIDQSLNNIDTSSGADEGIKSIDKELKVL